jgi:hypothetical protein
MFLAMIYPGLIFFLSGFVVSESPRWLFRRGKKDQALAALRRSCSEEEAQLELREMETLVHHQNRGAPGAQTRSHESGGLHEPVTSKSPPATIASWNFPTGDPCLRCFSLSGGELLFQCPYASLLIFNRVKNGINHLHSNRSVFAKSAHFPSPGFEFVAILFYGGSCFFEAHFSDGFASL